MKDPLCILCKEGRVPFYELPVAPNAPVCDSCSRLTQSRPGEDRVKAEPVEWGLCSLTGRSHPAEILFCGSCFQVRP